MEKEITEISLKGTCRTNDDEEVSFQDVEWTHTNS